MSRLPLTDQSKTAIKPVMADHSVLWEEPLVIRARPLVFPHYLIPVFSSTSKAVHLEIRASFETTMLGRSELVGRDNFRRLAHS